MATRQHPFNGSFWMLSDLISHLWSSDIEHTKRRHRFEGLIGVTIGGEDFLTRELGMMGGLSFDINHHQCTTFVLPLYYLCTTAGSN